MGRTTKRAVTREEPEHCRFPPKQVSIKHVRKSAPVVNNPPASYPSSSHGSEETSEEDYSPIPKPRSVESEEDYSSHSSDESVEKPEEDYSPRAPGSCQTATVAMPLKKKVIPFKKKALPFEKTAVVAEISSSSSFASLKKVVVEVSSSSSSHSSDRSVDKLEENYSSRAPGSCHTATVAMSLKKKKRQLEKKKRQLKKALSLKKKVIPLKKTALPLKKTAAVAETSSSLKKAVVEETSSSSHSFDGSVEKSGEDYSPRAPRSCPTAAVAMPLKKKAVVETSPSSSSNGSMEKSEEDISPGAPRYCQAATVATPSSTQGLAGRKRERCNNEHPHMAARSEVYPLCRNTRIKQAPPHITIPAQVCQTGPSRPEHVNVEVQINKELPPSHPAQRDHPTVAVLQEGSSPSVAAPSTVPIQVCQTSPSRPEHVKVEVQINKELPPSPPAQHDHPTVAVLQHDGPSSSVPAPSTSRLEQTYLDPFMAQARFNVPFGEAEKIKGQNLETLWNNMLLHITKGAFITNVAHHQLQALAEDRSNLLDECEAAKRRVEETVTALTAERAEREKAKNLLMVVQQQVHELTQALATEKKARELHALTVSVETRAMEDCRKSFDSNQLLLDEYNHGFDNCRKDIEREYPDLNLCFLDRQPKRAVEGGANGIEQVSGAVGDGTVLEEGTGHVTVLKMVKDEAPYGDVCKGICSWRRG